METTIKTLAKKADLANVRKEIGKAKIDTIKWMFIFWFGQIGVTLAVVLLILKK